MPGRDASIVASVLRDPLARVAELGGDPAALCARAGVALHGEAGALPLAAFVAFFQEAARMLGAPGFGWSTGAVLDIATLGPAGQTIARAPRLGAGLRLFCDSFAAVQGASELELEVAEGRAQLRYRILDPAIWPRDQDAELTLSVLEAYIRRAAGPAWRPDEIWFEHAPRDAGAARRFDAPVRFLAPVNALVFAERVLDRPLPEAEAEAFRAAARTLAAAAHAHRQGLDLPRRVAREILRSFGFAPVSQAEVARRLGLSRRSLRRHLEDCGTQFSEILADCRDQAAMRLLGSGCGIEETALRLGYADAAAFSRAFRARQGLPPGRWLLAQRRG
ncbi:MAG: AraC family transcriptional regulator [Rhodobacteraceae bacterium]|nr:AraC family transcriptional regulator [Paracoccaceae bacterium]